MQTHVFSQYFPNFSLTPHPFLLQFVRDCALMVISFAEARTHARTHARGQMIERRWGAALARGNAGGGGGGAWTWT